MMVAANPAASLTYSDKFMSRLQNSLKASRKILRDSLTHRETILKAYAGAHYGRPQGADRRPINKIQQAITVYTRLLAAKNPAVMCRTKNKELKLRADTFGATMSALLPEIRFQEEMRFCVLDACMSWGMAKVGLAPAGFVKVGDFVFDPGQPYFARVSPDYCFLDLHARNWGGMQYMGDLTLRNFEEMTESGKYKNLDKIDPQRHDMTESGQVRASQLSKPKEGAEDRIFDEVEVLELYVPKDNTVLCLSYPDYYLLSTTEYDGPEDGPYEMLGYGEVPDSIIPIGPAQAWVDLDDLINRLVRKMGRQAERQKTILGFHGADRDDARRIVNADDGETIRVDNPNVQAAMKEINFGGVRPESSAYVIYLLNQINDLTNNIQAMAGIAPQSGTVGQDNLLAQQSNVQMGDLRDRTIQFAKKNIDKLAWYRWNHPSETQVKLTVPGTNLEFSQIFGPLNREGDLSDYDLDLEPYSMQPSSPQAEYRKLVELLQGVLMPLAPMFQQAGVVFSPYDLTERMGKYNDIKDLASILQAAPPPPPPGMEQGGGGMAEGPGKPPVTTRNYVRENRSVGVPRNENMQLANAMMGAAANNGPRT